jgi:hypothetical protein
MENLKNWISSKNFSFVKVHVKRMNRQEWNGQDFLQRRSDKTNYRFIDLAYQGLLLSNENEQATDTWNNLGGSPGNYSK